MKVEKSNLIKILLNYKITPTYQRLKILEFLYNNRTHPSVEEIIDGLSSEIISISKATVYNTLKLFLNKGLLKELNIEKNHIRYDIDTSIHSHFICIKCGKIYDLKMENDNKLIVENGFKILDSKNYIYGICKNCNKDKGG